MASKPKKVELTASAPRRHRIRTTIEPGKTILVDDAELLDLTRQGLIATDAPENEPETPEDTDTENGADGAAEQEGGAS